MVPNSVVEFDTEPSAEARRPSRRGDHRVSSSGSMLLIEPRRYAERPWREGSFWCNYRPVERGPSRGAGRSAAISSVLFDLDLRWFPDRTRGSSPAHGRGDSLVRLGIVNALMVGMPGQFDAGPWSGGSFDMMIVPRRRTCRRHRGRPRSWRRGLSGGDAAHLATRSPAMRTCRTCRNACRTGRRHWCSGQFATGGRIALGDEGPASPRPTKPNLRGRRSADGRRRRRSSDGRRRYG